MAFEGGTMCAFRGEHVCCKGVMGLLYTAATRIPHLLFDRGHVGACNLALNDHDTPTRSTRFDLCNPSYRVDSLSRRVVCIRSTLICLTTLQVTLQ